MVFCCIAFYFKLSTLSKLFTLFTGHSANQAMTHCLVMHDLKGNSQPKCLSPERAMIIVEPLQVPNSGKEVRFKIIRNIGTAFVRMGQFQVGVRKFLLFSSFTMNPSVVVESPPAAFCHHSLGA